MVIDYILPFVNEHAIIVSFLGGFITGETFIIALAFLSATGLIPLKYLLIFCTLGMYLSDFIPFTIGKFRVLRRFIKGKNIVRAKKIEGKFLKYTHNSLFFAIFYTKFIYGASIPSLIYLGHKKVSYLKFAVYNFLVEIIFVPLVILIGWLGGQGFTLAMDIFKDLRISLFVLILFIVIIYFLRRGLDQRLKERK